MTTQKSFWFLFGGIWLTVGLVFAVTGAGMLWYEQWLGQQLAQDGAIASGIVLAKSERGRRNEAPTYRVEYRFTLPDGAVIEQSVTVSRNTWDALVEGGAVRIAYVRDAPHRHRVQLQSGEFPLLAATCTAVGSLFALAGTMIVWRARTRHKLVERVRREGLRASAEVIEVVPVSVRVNRMPQWVVVYRYRDRLGNAHDGRSPYMAQEEAQRWQPGDRVEIGYEPDQPQRSVWMAAAAR